MSHCLICNTITEYSDLHSLCDKDHEENLKDALISDKLVEDNLYSRKESQKDTVLKDSTETEENDNEWIEVGKKKGKVIIETSVTTNESQRSHVAPNKFFCTACSEYISTLRRPRHYMTEKHVFNSKSKHHYLMTEIENELFCIVCDVKITNDIRNVKKHVYEMAHVKKYNQILAENKIKQLTGIFYCEPCDKVILFKHELRHINEKSHQTKCFSDEYSMSEDETIEKENDEMPIDYFHCDVCNIKVPNYERNIQEHMKGKKHASNVERTNPTSDNDDDVSVQSVQSVPKTVSKIHYLMENTKFSSFLNCKVCNVNLLHDETWVRDHLASVKHKINYKKLLKDNHLVLKKDNCYCNVCRIPIGIKNELMHVGGKKHNRMLQENLELLSSSSVSKPSAVIDSKVSTDKQNLLPLSRFNVKCLNNIDTPSVSNANDINNIDNISMSNAKAINDIDKPSVSSAKDVNNKDMSSSDSNALSKIENPDIEPEMLALLEPTHNPKEVVCKICKVTVPFNVYNVTTHIDGMKHKLAQEALLEEEEAKID